MNDNTIDTPGAEATEHSANPFSDPAAPLNVHVRLECWNGDDAIEIDSVDFDGRAIFDAEPLDSVSNDLSDLDWVFYSAAASGFIDSHDGPFTVEVPEELDEYIAHRESAGMTDAYPSAGESIKAMRRSRLAAQLEQALAEVERLRAAIENEG